MKAIILSCNEGSRLRPVTCSIPQSMLPVMGRSLIEHTVRSLYRYKIEDITFMSDYLTDTVRKHFDSLSGYHISFSHAKPLGDIINEDDVLVIADSILTDIDFGKAIEVFKNKACTTLITFPDLPFCQFGCVHTDSEGFASKYIRCPDFTHCTGHTFSGIMIIPKGTTVKETSDLPSLVESLFEGGKKINSYSPNCYIRNISDFEVYHKCNRDFMDKKINLPFPCDERAPGVWIDENATVMQGSVLVPPVYVGKGSIVSKGARLEAYTQLLEEVSVDCFANIKRSIVMNSCHIDEGVSLRGAIVCSGSDIGYESAVYEGSVIASGCTLGKHCTVKSGVHIWPEKHIDDESIISENIVWGENCGHSLFFDGCAYGIINREITPEFCSVLAGSVCRVLGKKIAVSSGSGGAGAMIKNALLSGIQSAGGIAYDLGEQPLAITRSGVKFYGLDGAIALSCRKKDGCLYGSLDILNGCGANVENEELQKISVLTQSRDFSRENPLKIHDGEFLFEYKLYYLKQLINSTSKKPLGKKILIHCPILWAKELLESAAHDLKCSFVFTDTSQKEHFLVELSDASYDFGAIFDYKCETVTLISGHGQILSEFDYDALTSLIIMKSFKNATIYVPESAPESIDVMAEKYGATIYRTLISPPHLMNELSKEDRKMFLHQFIYRFDAVGTIILLSDFLYSHNTTIDRLAGEIPASYMVNTNISYKGRNCRELMQKICKKHNQDSDGSRDFVKIDFENGWVIIVPKKSESAINVISHGFSKEYAREIADIFMDDLSD